MPETKTKAKTQEVNLEETMERDQSFDYVHKASFKLSDKFKQMFGTKTAGGGETISADGLTALGHIKGMWKCEVEVLQFPNAENGNTCICRAEIGGYDWDPVQEKIVRVEYSDIGDASPNNCNRNVAPHYIRMASTRAISRALRKYTNVDMLCTEELGDDDVATAPLTEVAVEKYVDASILSKVKILVNEKGITRELFTKILTDNFNTGDYQQLTMSQGEQLITILTNYIPTN